MPPIKKKKKEDLLGEYVFFGIFSGVLALFFVKMIFGAGVDLVTILFIELGVSAVVVAGFYLLSLRSVRHEVFNFKIDLVYFLQNCGMLPLEYKVEEENDTKKLLKRIFSLLSGVIEKHKAAVKRNSDLEDTLSKFADVKTGNLRDINEIKGKVKNVTVLFVDIRGFTSLTEKLNSEEIMKFLNSYFSYITKIVMDNNGHVNKFIGDAVMAIFEHENSSHEVEHPLRAVNTADEIHKNLHVVFEESQITLATPAALAVGVGINTGEAVTGTVGSSARMEHTYIGDMVNLSSRLAEMAGPGVTLIGAGTYETVRDKVVALESEPVGIRGKTGLHKVYIVKGINLIDRGI